MQPLYWSVEQGQGRGDRFDPGHFAWTFDGPLLRLPLHGMSGSARAPVDRFNDLVTAEARVQLPAEKKRGGRSASLEFSGR